MGERKIWFITRPERDPASHREALIALEEATNEFTIKWKGNREAHKKYEEILVNKKIKRNNISNDGSGGRTWAAMLRTFSYCYIDDKGRIVLTKSGKKIIEGINVYENIKKQILTLQIPNAYFLETGFRPHYEEGFSIRPVRFLIKLCLQDELQNYLTMEEITFFAMTAKKDNQIEEVTNKIKEFRLAAQENKNKIKSEIADTYDHRERSDKGARDFYAAHSDVAHTFMLISKFTGLVEYANNKLQIKNEVINRNKKEIERYDIRYPFNTRYLISLQRMAENNGLDIDSYKASNYGDIKPASNKRKSIQKAEKLIYQYSKPTLLSYDEKVNILIREFPIEEAKELVAELESNISLTAINGNFIESYINQPDDRAFEDMTGQIFKELGFNVIMRPKPCNSEGTQIEILVEFGSNKFGIIDAKNYKHKFILSALLASHMASEYIRIYKKFDNRKIQFFGYVTANDIGGAKNLNKISKLAKHYINNRKIEGFMINSTTLLAFLDYCIENDIPQNKRTDLFLMAIDNSAYTNFDIFLNKIRS